MSSKGAAGSEIARTGAAVNAILSLLKALRHSDDQDQRTFFFVSSMSGATRLA